MQIHSGVQAADLMSGRDRTRPPLDGITKMYISYFFMEPRTSESAMRLTIHTDYTLRVLMQPALPREHSAATTGIVTRAPNAVQAIGGRAALARPRHRLSAPFRPKKPRLP